MMKYRRLLSSYRCHQYRGKSHLQIILELLARLIKSPSVSEWLMQRALKRHGVLREISATEVLSHRSEDRQSVGRGEIVSGRFFVELRDAELWAAYRSQFDAEIRTVIEDAETICLHAFDLLGSGLTCWGNPIDWHIDPVSNYRWPKKFFFELKRQGNSPARGDVKVPWELSRMQHLPTLGQAYRLTKNERYAREIVDQITHWWDTNPCPYGVNWTCAMDVAIRIVNIIWAYLLIEDASTVTGAFRTRLAAATFQHAQFVLFNLEYGIRDDGIITNGNHYLTNIVGLLHLGLVCPEFPMAETWRRVGLSALVEEMERQVYPDGVDFESSIAYHRLVLELFLAGALLCRVHGVSLPDRFWKRLERMFEFVLWVTRPDGKVPQVGDADDGRLYILSDYSTWDRNDFRYLLAIGAVLFQRRDMKTAAGAFSEEAFWLLGPSGIAAFEALKHDGTELGSKGFQDSGFYVMRMGNKYLLACCGGRGNHKHNDLLSFELYADDKAFIVDPGSYVYTRSPTWRNLFRSTRYHNTVVIDAQEQNRFEATRLFEMSADATVIVHAWLSTPDVDWLDVEHTGYTRLTCPVQHRRIFQFNKRPGTWKITDVLTGAGEHTADWFLHFDQGIELEPVGEGMFRTRCEGTNLVLVARSEIPLICSIEDGWISRRYGHKLPARLLHMSGRFNTGCHMALAIHAV